MAEISSPFLKAGIALGGSGGAMLTSKTQATTSFLPYDLAGWMAVFASAAACLYSVHLLGEWYWKKVIKPWLREKGWLR